MLIRLCNRCQAPATLAEIASSMKTLVIPTSDPSTNAVSADVEVSIGIQIAPQDLCGICQASALLEYALSRLGPTLTAAAVTILSARVTAVTGIGAVTPVPAPPIAKPPLPVTL